MLREIGFKTPSEIQAAAIPTLLGGDTDFIGLAQTGTGKTAAFGLPLIELVNADVPKTQALILAPTRELGQQIAEQLSIFGKYKSKLSMLAVYGGAPIQHQLKALKKPQHIIIATPGRLLDLLRRKAINLGVVEYLVLDEADEMLNMGFKEDLDQILSHTPGAKRTWLFSATMSKEIRRIVKTYMEDPKEVRLSAENEVNQNITHQYAIVRRSDRKEALTRFIDLNTKMRSVVFCRTKRDTQKLAEELLKQNYKADALHGDLSQRQRDRVMRRFKTHELQLLIATDVAARGIDVNDLTHVIHFALPDDFAYYTHRSGRTARAGKKGVSLAFIDGREKGKIINLSRKLDIEFHRVLVPKAHEIQSQKIDRWCHDILELSTKGKVDRRQFERVNMLLSKLSKEELIAKLLVKETGGLVHDVSGRDLNDKEGQRKPKNKKSGHFQTTPKHLKKRHKQRNNKKKKGKKNRKKFRHWNSSNA